MQIECIAAGTVEIDPEDIQQMREVGVREPLTQIFVRDNIGLRSYYVREDRFELADRLGIVLA